MALADDLESEVKKIFKASWTVDDGRVVPEPSSLRLDNHAILLKQATVLYADLDGSTAMVQEIGWEKSAEIYKTFLYCCARLIRTEGATITSYDGDRVMGIFIGDSQSSDAAKCALKINYAVKKIILPALRTQYSNDALEFKHVVGIDFSEIRAARTGVRGDNDIVWVGRAANYAAKLTEENSATPTWITEAVYDRLNEASKLSSGTNMWKKWLWKNMGNIPVYSSTYWWTV